MDEAVLRSYLQAILEQTFPELTVYYRPPGNLQLERPCIIYEPKAYEPSFANNDTYVVGTRFQITMLSNLPGHATRDMYALARRPGVVINRAISYVNEDIVHDVFTISVNSIS